MWSTCFRFQISMYIVDHTSMYLTNHKQVHTYMFIIPLLMICMYVCTYYC